MTEEDIKNNLTLIELFDTFSDLIIAFNPIYAKITGSTDAGILLSQFVYWAKNNPKKMIDKTMSEIEEVTCLSRRQQDTSRNILESLDFIKIEKIGIPRRNTYYINKINIVKKILEYKNPIKSYTHQNANTLESNTCENANTLESTTYIENESTYPHLIKSNTCENANTLESTTYDQTSIKSNTCKNANIHIYKELNRDIYIKEESYPQEEKRNKTPAGIVCTEWVSAGIQCNPSHPDLLLLLEQGVTEQELIDTGNEAQQRGINNMAWILKTVKNRRIQAARQKEELEKNPLPKKQEINTNKNKAISTNAAYHEAIEQIEKRENGNDAWSHPAIFYAAKALGNDLRQFRKADIYQRWSSALDDALNGLKNGSLSSEIPKKLKSDPENFKPASKNELIVAAIKRGANIDEIKEISKSELNEDKKAS